MTGSRNEIGVNLPIPVQYWRYLMKVLHGDFGISLITAHPVLQDMLRVFPATLELAAPGAVSSARCSAFRSAWSPPPIAAAGRIR